MADAVDPPRVKRTEFRPLTGEEARQLLEVALFVVALSTGMREGELLGLRWTDINLEKAYLQLMVTLQRTRKGLSLSEPKTSYSRRKVLLTEAAVAALALLSMPIPAQAPG